MEQGPSWELVVAQLVKHLLSFMENWSTDFKVGILFLECTILIYYASISWFDIIVASDLYTQLTYRIGYKCNNASRLLLKDTWFEFKPDI